MKFRKKPIVIEAVQLTRSNWGEVCEFAGVGGLNDGRPAWSYSGVPGEPPEPGDDLWLLIPALEGLLIASEGDWIIRGVAGELYPCKPDIFEATYEPVEDSHE